jgi:hypothetical protein
MSNPNGKNFTFQITTFLSHLQIDNFTISSFARIEEISLGDSPVFPLLHSSLHHVMAKIVAHLFK